MNLTDEQMRAANTSILDRMVHHGWVHQYTFTVGKGFHVGWTLEGAHRSIELARIARAAGLVDAASGEIALRPLAQGEGFPVLLRSVTERDVEFFEESLRSLGLGENDAGRLWVLLHIVTEWAPDGDTPFRFGQS